MAERMVGDCAVVGIRTIFAIKKALKMCKIVKARA
jgi:hypothetical protein